MGDGVNIAARLEGLCEPGGVCLSEDAYRQVKGRLDLAVTDLGQTQLKNIAEPIRVYSLQVGAPAQAKAAATATAAIKPGSAATAAKVSGLFSRWPMLIAAAPSIWPSAATRWIGWPISCTATYLRIFTLPVSGLTSTIQAWVVNGCELPCAAVRHDPVAGEIVFAARLAHPVEHQLLA